VTDISGSINSDNSAGCRVGRIVIRSLRISVIGIVCLCFVLLLALWTLRRVAVSQIARLTQAEVQTRSVDVSLTGSVLIRQLVLRPAEQRGDDYAIFKAGTVHGRFNMGSLFLLRPRLREVTINNFVLDARYDVDTGRWNIANFGSSAAGGGFDAVPSVSLESGTIKYSRVSNGQVSPVAVVPVEATLGPAAEREQAYEFAVTTAEGPWGFGRSDLTGLWKQGQVTLTGSFSSADIAAFEKVWTIYVVAAELKYDPNNDYSVKLVLRDLQNTRKAVADESVAPEPAFLRNLGVFPTLQRFFARFDPQGRVDIEFRATGNLERLAESTVSSTVNCRDVSICDRRFPYVVKQIVGPIELTGSSAELKNLSGRHGEVEVTFNGWFRSSGLTREYDIRIGSPNMALDEDLYKALNTRNGRWWSSCSPRGAAAIDYRTARTADDGRKTTLAVKLLGAQAVYEGFPYPLNNLTGTVFFDDKGTTFSDVVSQFADRTITISGRITNHNTTRPLCDLTIHAENIPLDSTLSACLSDRQRSLYDGLNMSGRAEADVKVSTPKDSNAAATIETEIYLKDAALKPDYVSQGLDSASGKVFVAHDLIRIENLRGNCASGTVSVTGRMWPDSDPVRLRYDLVLDGRQAELADGLPGLLPKSLAAMVSGLEPNGKVNYTAELSKPAGVLRPDYRLSIDCLGNSFHLESLPYPLENVTGSLSIATDDTADAIIAATGQTGVSQGGRAVRVSGRLRQADDQTQEPRFVLDLEKFRVFCADDGNDYVDLSAAALFKNCDLKASTGIRELDGLLHIKGLYEVGEGFVVGQGSLKAAGLKVGGSRLEQISANIYYDCARRCWLSENLNATCHGGKVNGKLEFQQEGPDSSQYLLQVCFDNIDLREFLAEREKQTNQEQETLFVTAAVPTDQIPVSDNLDTGAEETGAPGQTGGTMGGSLSIRGRIGESHSRIGRCRLKMNNVRVGRMPPLAKVLCVLKMNEPTDFAFDRMLVDAYIRHDRVLLEHLDLSGQALDFTGSGQMDLENHNLDLVLFARGQRLATAEPTVLQSLTEGFGQALVRLEVTGDYCEPKVRTTALPVITGFLGAGAPRPGR